MSKKTQRDAVVEAMQREGGFATLRTLYREVPMITDVVWKTRTPRASIRRIVQDARYFMRVEPGLWALRSELHRLPQSILDLIPGIGSPEKRKEGQHYYYQGLLLEIGNLRKMNTYVPPQDKRRLCAEKTLGEIASLKRLPAFTWEDILKRIGTIDVIWINDRFPESVFEVENSPRLEAALRKFAELRNFMTDMYVVGPSERKPQLESVLKYRIYKELRGRVKFWSYDQVELKYAAALDSGPSDSST